MKQAALHLALAIILSYNSAFSQHSFAFEYTGTYTHHARDVVETSDNSFIILAGQHDYYSQVSYNVKLIKLSANGRLVHATEIAIPDSVSSLIRLHRIPGITDEFIGTGIITPSNNPAKTLIHIVRFDAQLNQLVQRHIALPGNIKVLFFYSCFDDYGNVVIAGSFSNEPHPWASNMFIARISLSGLLLGFKAFLYPPYQIANDIIQIRAPSLQYGVTVTGPFPGSNHSESFVVFDSLLNIQLTYPIPIISGFGNTTVLNYEQSGFIFSGKTVKSNSYLTGMYQPIFNLFNTSTNKAGFSNLTRAYTIVKTDKNLKVSKQRTIASGGDTVVFPAAYRATNYINSSFLYNAGIHNIDTRPEYAFFQPEPTYISINKLDPDLNIIGQRFYGHDAYYDVLSVSATSDGGCMVMGFKYKFAPFYYKHDLFVLKITKDLLLSVNDEPGSRLLREVILYPNPGTTQLFIQTGHTGLHISIYDLRGSRQYEGEVTQMWHVINTSLWPAGIYYYRITKTNAMIDSGKWIKVK